jgi:hypothetical protein
MCSDFMVCRNQTARSLFVQLQSGRGISVVAISRRRRQAGSMKARLLLLTLCVLGGLLFAGEKFTPMFNGKDFSGWRFTSKDGKAPNWSVKDGVIHLTGGGSPHLASVKAYGDFEMIFEWRALREKYNSGFFIRARKNVGNNQLNLAKGGEGKFIGGKIKGGKAVPELQKKPGEWNEWRVLVVGDKVTFWCNGKLAWKGEGIAPATGHIGLQAEGAPMEFRKLRIREIK